MVELETCAERHANISTLVAFEALQKTINEQAAINFSYELIVGSTAVT